MASSTAWTDERNPQMASSTAEITSPSCSSTSASFQSSEVSESEQAYNVLWENPDALLANLDQMIEDEKSFGNFLMNVDLTEKQEKGSDNSDDESRQINPYGFCSRKEMLSEVRPQLNLFGYRHLDVKMPEFVVGSEIKLGDETYSVLKRVGKGYGYQKSYLLARKTDDGDGNEGKIILAKLQSFSGLWEFYITNELKQRLSLPDQEEDMSKSVLIIEKALFYQGGNCFLNEFNHHGTLLEFIKSHRPKKGPFLPEWLVLLFSIKLFHLVAWMHKCHIIHGDFKPDNILICHPLHLRPDESSLSLIHGSASFLKLTNFCHAIDMTKFPPGTTFLITQFAAPALLCPEIISYRPWNYQVDYFGLASTIYTLLTGCKMDVRQKKNGHWTVLPKFPGSYRSYELWKQMFEEFLNIPDCDSLPSLLDYRTRFEAVFKEEFSMEEYGRFVAELEAQQCT